MISDSDPSELIAEPRDARGRPTRISPPFSIEDFVRHPETRKRIGIRLWVVVRDLERFLGRQIIERVHYLVAPGRGMLLVAAFASTDEQEDLRRFAMRQAKAEREELDSPAWRAAPGGIVGVGVLEALYHGNPAQGRAEFATAAVGSNEWLQWSRSEIVRQIRIAWASRFAVDRPYHGHGIGTLLAKHLKTVARHYRAPAADFLEVITTEQRGHAQFGDNRFLVQAGYKMCPKPMKSAPLRRIDRESGYLISYPAIKHYYWADLRDATRKR